MVEPTTTAIQKVVARKQAQEAKSGQSVMSLGEHLSELRRRLVWAILGLAPIFVGSLVFGRQLMQILIRPMEKALMAEGQDPNLQAMGIFETFSTYVLIALITTIVFGFPWVLIQAWKFVSPGLYLHERRVVYRLFPLSVILTISGVVFMYFVVLPVMLTFMVHFTVTVGLSDSSTTVPVGEVALPSAPVFKGDPTPVQVGNYWFNSERNQMRYCKDIVDGKPIIVVSQFVTPSGGIKQQTRLRDYIDQLLMVSLAFAAAFQAPIVVLLLGWIGVIQVATLSKYRKHAVFVIVVVSAVMTPPDPLSVFLLAVPLYILYEFGVLLLRMFPSPGKLAMAGDSAAVKEGNIDDE